MKFSQLLIGAAMNHCIENCPRNLAESPSGFIGSLTQRARRWLQLQRVRIEIQRERDSLLTMSDAMLNDIGIDRSAALREAQRADIPASRCP
jgi:uncharacterized protein YjiS (DUF1127 family)